MPDTDYPIKDCDLPFGVTKLIVYFFVSLKEVLTEMCKGNNPFKWPFPAAVTHQTQFETNPKPTPTRGRHTLAWHTCPFIWIPEQEDNHHHIVGCPADEERDDDDHGDAQRFHFGLVNQSLAVRLCRQLFRRRVVGQLGALEHFLAACQGEK